MKRVLALVLVLVFALGFALTGCKTDDPATTDPTEAPTEAPDEDTDDGDEVEATPEPPPASTRTGGWLDEITMIGVEEAAAVTQLTAGEVDIYAGSLPGDFLSEIEGAGLEYCVSTGLNYEIYLNNADTLDTAGTFNPFGIREIREALNWLIDRDYICQEIFGGAAIPRYFPVGSVAPDYARYIQYFRAEEAVYAYNPEKAAMVIEEAMLAAGAVKDADGKWTYDGEIPLLVFLMRTEDGKRQPIGDYVANELEDLGFTIDRQYKTSGECWALWGSTDPFEGQWHLYTGAWGASGLTRDSGIYWKDFNAADSRYGMWGQEAYQLTDEYQEVVDALANTDFVTMDEREELFAKAIADSNHFATRIWLADGLAYTPWMNTVSTSYNLSAGVDGSTMTTYTLRFAGEEGGSLVWANSSPPFVNPVNPIAGSNWTYDAQYQNFTQDYALIADPFTGLNYPKLATGADVVIQSGLPVSQTYDWVNLSFEDEIMVPNDVMIDFDVATGKYIMADAAYLAGKLADAQADLEAAEAAEDATESSIALAQADVDAAQADVDRGYLTAKKKSVVYYAEDLYENTWHDGTPISVADFLMVDIMSFANAYEESPLFDPFVAPSILSSLPYSKGWKIVSVDPLVIESYSDVFSLDAEANVTTMWPEYGYGQGSWSNIAVSNLGVLDGSVSWSEGVAAESETMEWLNWLDGPSMDIMANNTIKAKEEGHIPFEATLGMYITAEEADTAYQNMMDFYLANGHFYIGCGPYYISNVMATEGSITLSRYEAYRDLSSRWSFLSEPKLAIVELDGPGSIDAGAEATFDVFVSFGDDMEAYPATEIGAVTYLLFDPTGEIVEVMNVEAAEDGLYTITLTADVVSKLGSGSCKMEVVVSPLTVAAPSIVSTEFVVG